MNNNFVYLTIWTLYISHGQDTSWSKTSFLSLQAGQKEEKYEY